MTSQDVRGSEGKHPKLPIWRRLGHRLSKRALAVAVLLLALLIAGVAVGTVVSGWLNSSKKGSGSTASASPKETPAVEEINHLLATGDSEGVAKKVAADSSLANSIDGQLVLAAAAVNSGKMDDALKIYLDAGDKYGWRSDAADQVALIYAGKGEKTKAISYYEKEKQLLDKNDPSYDSQVQRIDESIKGLK
jgi:hypothetical protein